MSFRLWSEAEPAICAGDIAWIHLTSHGFCAMTHGRLCILSTHSSPPQDLLNASAHNLLIREDQRGTFVEGLSETHVQNGKLRLRARDCLQKHTALSKLCIAWLSSISRFRSLGLVGGPTQLLQTHSKMILCTNQTKKDMVSSWPLCMVR
jgi:hypothetical protein